jgi:hypothetical protein
MPCRAVPHPSTSLPPRQNRCRWRDRPRGPRCRGTVASGAGIKPGEALPARRWMPLTCSSTVPRRVLSWPAQTDGGVFGIGNKHYRSL